jgi:hypothetical protein
VINFYHDVRDPSSLDALLGLDIDAVIPTLVIGDFNCHSQSWSPPDIPRSRRANCLEEWTATNLLTLANTPGVITRKGANNDRDSVIDLAWYNEAAILASTFSGLTVDWAGSLGSDHAMLHISGNTDEPSPGDNNKRDDLGYVIDPDKSNEWSKAFKERSHRFAFQPTPAEAEVEEEAAIFMADIHQTNEEIFRK